MLLYNRLIERMRVSIVLLFIAASVLCLTHFIALEFYLYWQYIWLDMPVHALGGAIAALALFALRDAGLRLPQGLLRLPMVLLFVLAVGAAWEMFEVWAGIPVERNYVLDTTIDITMDLLGALAGFLVGKAVHSLDA